jgi:hypothetical protein
MVNVAPEPAVARLRPTPTAVVTAPHMRAGNTVTANGLPETGAPTAKSLSVLTSVVGCEELVHRSCGAAAEEPDQRAAR